MIPKISAKISLVLKEFHESVIGGIRGISELTRGFQVCSSGKG